jgi:hypothetical protein
VCSQGSALTLHIFSLLSLLQILRPTLNFADCPECSLEGISQFTVSSSAIRA